jgi:methylmalonyl-CoA mutase N-terminal domain/subunit
LDINTFARRISFSFNAHNNLLKKLRSFVLQEECGRRFTKELGATDARAQMLRFHSQTGGSTLTAQQP